MREMEKRIPASEEAERGVLGSLLIDPDAITRVDGYLSAEDFISPINRAIYEAILSLSQRGMAADCLTVCDEVERQQITHDAGLYLACLIRDVPTSGNIEHYAHIVAEKAILRRLLYAAGQIAANAYDDGADASTVLEQAEQSIYSIQRRRRSTDFSSGEEIAAAYLDKLTWLHEHRGEVLGVPTGYPELDQYGGFQAPDLIVCAGRPGMGKTALALNFAYNALVKYGMRVGIFSLEMSKEQLMARFFSMHSGIDSQYLRTGSLDEDDWSRVVASYDLFAHNRLWIDDTAAISTMELRSKARRLQAEHGLDLLIVDYLQLMTVSTQKNGKAENRVQEISEISRSLKALAKELNVPVLALSQLSRAVESRVSKKPMLSDLRESGGIEQDSDIVLLMYRDDYYAGYDEQGNSLSACPGTCEINIAKHRNGPTGYVTLGFGEKTTRFLPLYQGEEERSC